MNDFPKYFIIGLRPVKIIRNDEGGVGSLAYNWETVGLIWLSGILTKFTLVRGTMWSRFQKISLMNTLKNCVPN